MSTYAVLDLFAGLGGFSAAFRDSEQWNVTTVEIEEKFDPDIQADVFDLRPSDFETEFGVVLASPPCTRLGKMAMCNGYFDGTDPQTDDAADHVALAYHTLGLIRGLNPEWWFMENPPGRMKDFLGRPAGTVTYCQYGKAYMKRTHLWGDHPPGMGYLAAISRPPEARNGTRVIASPPTRPKPRKSRMNSPSQSVTLASGHLTAMRRSRPRPTSG